MDLALLSRIAGIIFTPSNFFLLLLILGVLLQGTRWRRLGKGLVIAVALSFLLVFFLPLDNWLATPLENRFHRPPWPAHVDGMIVLGGGENGAVFAARGAMGPSAGESRLIAAAELARRYPHARLIFSGGMEPLAKGEMSEADVARAIFAQLGVPPSRLTLESRSRNTWENFLLQRTRPAATRRNMAAGDLGHTHAPRHGNRGQTSLARAAPALGLFHHGRPGGIRWNSSLTSHLGTIELAVHEWEALPAYWLMGRLGDTER